MTCKYCNMNILCSLISIRICINTSTQLSVYDHDQTDDLMYSNNMIILYYLVKYTYKFNRAYASLRLTSVTNNCIML